jgi:aubergine-like protein
VLKVVRA